jgi:hypothetical protein
VERILGLSPLLNNFRNAQIGIALEGLGDKAPEPRGLFGVLPISNHYELLH